MGEFWEKLSDLESAQRGFHIARKPPVFVINQA